MPLEQRADPGDPRLRAFREAAGPEVSFHLPAYGVPVRLGHARGDCAVGDDLDVAVRHQYVDQHAVVALGIPDAEMAKHEHRPLARRRAKPEIWQVEGSLDREADLARVTVLECGDALLDASAHVGGEPAARAPAR